MAIVALGWRGWGMAEMVEKQLIIKIEIAYDRSLCNFTAHIQAYMNTHASCSCESFKSD